MKKIMMVFVKQTLCFLLVFSIGAPVFADPMRAFSVGLAKESSRHLPCSPQVLQRVTERAKQDADYGAKDECEYAISVVRTTEWEIDARCIAASPAQYGGPYYFAVARASAGYRCVDY